MAQLQAVFTNMQNNETFNSHFQIFFIAGNKSAKT